MFFFDFLHYFYIRFFNEALWSFGQGDILMGCMILIVAILLLVLTVFIIGIVLIEVYDLIDTSQLPTRKVRGTIQSKRFVPAHTTILLSGKVSVPVYHPDRWNAEIAADGAHELIDIDQAIYGEIRAGSDMDVLVVTGRLSKRSRIVGY